MTGVSSVLLKDLRAFAQQNLNAFLRPKAKVTVKFAMTFGPSGLPLDPTAALQEYLKANGNKLPAPMNEAIKLKSISVAPPGMVMQGSNVRGTCSDLLRRKY